MSLASASRRPLYSSCPLPIPRSEITKRCGIPVNSMSANLTPGRSLRSSRSTSPLIDSLIFWGDDEKDQEKNDQSDKPSEDLKQQPEDSNEPEFTGIEAPEVKPIDEDYVPEEYQKNSDYKSDEEETWVSKLWPSWGDDDEDSILPKNEKRYRIRIKPSGENTSTVYLDYPNGEKNISKEASKVLKIINEHLK